MGETAADYQVSVKKFSNYYQINTNRPFQLTGRIMLLLIYFHFIHLIGKISLDNLIITNRLSQNVYHNGMISQGKISFNEKETKENPERVTHTERHIFMQILLLNYSLF